MAVARLPGGKAVGEKETMTGAEMREAGSGMATGRAAGASAAGEKVMTAREAGSGMATGT